MKKVPFTQYLRPSGRTQKIWTHISDELAEKVDQILAAGYHFTAEVIADDLVSFTISDDEMDYSIEISYNGPDVTSTIEGMIRKFDLGVMFGKRKEDLP